MKRLYKAPVIHAIIALAIGGFLYVFLYQDDPMGFHLTLDLPILRPEQSLVSLLIRYYAADFLWAYALYMLMFFTWEKTYTAFILQAAVSLFWEIGQGIGFFPGTFDFKDVLLYPAAGLIAVLIISFGRKLYHEKHASHHTDGSDRVSIYTNGCRK